MHISAWWAVSQNLSIFISTYFYLIHIQFNITSFPVTKDIYICSGFLMVAVIWIILSSTKITAPSKNWNITIITIGYMVKLIAVFPCSVWVPVFDIIAAVSGFMGYRNVVTPSFPAFRNIFFITNSALSIHVIVVFILNLIGHITISKDNLLWNVIYCIANFFKCGILSDIIINFNKLIK